MSFVGRSVTRLEDRPLVTGRGAFAADIAFPRMLHMRVVRSAHAHGRIMSIDASAALAMAGVVVELDLAVGRHSGVPLETRGAIARYDAARDMLELYGAAKVPHWNRASIARMLRRSPASVHLFEGHVGGGFGIRGELYPEDVLVCLAALRLARPVKWIEDRREHLIAANHSRQQRHRVRAAVDAEGRVLAIDDEFFHDQGD